MKPALSQVAAKGGALAMLAAMAACILSGDPIALVAFLIGVSIVQLLCLVEGPWTASLVQRLPVRSRSTHRG